MTDPSGLRVIEALCPVVSRYREACPAAFAPPLTEEEANEKIQRHIRRSLELAIAEMRSHDHGHYADLTG